MNLFNVVGNDLFKALTGKYQQEYADILEIIYNSYRTEISYGINRDILVGSIRDYFESDVEEAIILDDGEELKDSQTKASFFLRRLKAYGWVQSEFGSDGNEKIILPDYSVTLIQTLLNISTNREMEYQSEVSAIFSLLVNDKLYDRPYPQVIKPVYDRTIALFTELKKLNTSIRQYIDRLTEGLEEEVIQNFFEYNENIASKAYHRMKTNENISRFRNTIINRLKIILNNKELLDKACTGYQIIENCNDSDESLNNVVQIINNVIEHFNSYDEIEYEIDHKHTKYIRSAVNRAKLAFLNTNNIEGKISSVIRNLATMLKDNDSTVIYDEVPDEYNKVFNVFPQGFISSESLRSVPVSKRIGELQEVFDNSLISDEELQNKKRQLKEKIEQKFTRKNINKYVIALLKDKNEIAGSEIEINSRRDMVRIIFICLYGRDKKSDYTIVSKNNIVCKNGFSFKEFILKRRIK